VRDFKRKDTNWKKLKSIRGMIEDWSKSTKEAFSMKKFPFQIFYSKYILLFFKAQIIHPTRNEIGVHLQLL